MTVETERYCPICGRELPDLSIKRFGEYLCSEEHAEEFVQEVRAKKFGRANSFPNAQQETPVRSSWWGRRGGCCG